MFRHELGNLAIISELRLLNLGGLSHFAPPRRYSRVITMKAIVCSVSLVLCATPRLFGQSSSAAPKPEFEVASVKTAEPMTAGRFRIGMRVDEGRMAYENVTLRDCVRTAFRLKDYQISGPDWIGTERYDIIAKIPDGAGKDQVPEMLQTLLAERFRLAIHHESKPHDSYVLSVGKSGPKLAPAAPDDPALDPTNGPAAVYGGGGGGGRAEGPRMTISSGGGGGGGGMAVATRGMSVGGGNSMKMQLRKQTLDGFAQFLERFLGSPVVNQTGIAGTYDFALEMTLDEMMRGSGVMIMRAPGPAGGDSPNPAGSAEASDPGGALFRSIQNYGLKLDKKKEPLDLLVIDHIEKVPTEN